jgi:hypothetical protein
LLPSKKAFPGCNLYPGVVFFEPLSPGPPGSREVSLLLSAGPKVKEVLRRNPNLRQLLASVINDLEEQPKLLTFHLDEGWSVVVLLERHVALLDIRKETDESPNS